MTNKPQQIVYDPEAYKTRSMEGPFLTLAALESACVAMSASNKHWNAYADWAQKCNVSPIRGSILTTAYNPFYAQRRRTTLADQLSSYKADEKSGGGYPIPEPLRAVFEEASKIRSGDPYKALFMTTTRWTSFFDLRKSFPLLNLEAVCAAHEEHQARQCNDLIKTETPDLTDNLVYVSRWQDEFFHMAHIDFATLYLDKAGLKDLAQKIGQTQSRNVIFTNILTNTDPKGDEQWLGQRTLGGITPLRIPAKGELASVMKDAGYGLTEQIAAKADFPVTPGSVIALQNTWEHFSFARQSFAKPRP